MQAKKTAFDIDIARSRYDKSSSIPLRPYLGVENIINWPQTLLWTWSNGDYCTCSCWPQSDMYEGSQDLIHSLLVPRYKPAAKRGSVLFFSLAGLSSLNPM
jgi:hypothetical protein